MPVVIGDYKFELLSAEPNVRNGLDDAPDDNSPFYLSIRGQNGTPLTSTIMTHRFKTEQEASRFCEDVASGKYPIKQLMIEEQHALDHWPSERDHIFKSHFEGFMNDVQTMGVSPDTVQAIFALYDKLPEESRKMIFDPNSISEFKSNHPMPVMDNRISFGSWLEASKSDVDICLVDSDTGEHYLNAVCYLSPEDRRDPDLQYTPLENWLFTLPVDHVISEGGSAHLVVVNTQFTMPQTDFLLGSSEDGFDSQEWANLFDRAYYADADFEARLAFLTNGTPFEVPFDGNTMDALVSSDRKELCQFLESHDNAYVAPGQNDLLVVYTLASKAKGGIRVEDCAVCAKETVPGKGLASTLEGKVACAKHKAISGQTGTAKQANHEAERIS